MTEKEMGFYDFLDIAVAEYIGVEVDEYIRVIESVSEWRRSVVIEGLMSDNKESSFRAKALFFELQKRAQPPKC